MIVKLPDCNLSGGVCVRFFFRGYVEFSFREYVGSHNGGSCAVKVMQDSVFAAYPLLCASVIVEQLV